jgi:hypothetical protein
MSLRRLMCLQKTQQAMLLVGQKIVLSLLFLSDSNITLAKGDTPLWNPPVTNLGITWDE